MRHYLDKILLLICCLLTACDNSSTNNGTNDTKQVVIYSNADQEVLSAIDEALDKNGFKDKYILQSFGTAELGAKLLIEGKNLEADLITLSSYYIDSVQKKFNLFLPLTFKRQTLHPFPNYMAPTTSQVGAIIINGKLLESQKLPRPSKLEDLSKPVYKNQLSIIDPNGSSTAWLMVQAIIGEYGDGDKGKAIINGIIENAGPHIELSGSAPLKKLRAGEVAVGFGLRHQAVIDKLKGLPIDYIDPTEGNYSLIEAIAVLDKGEKTNPVAMKMAEVIIRDARPNLLKTYPQALYVGETINSDHSPAFPKTFPQPLTLELLEQHRNFFHNMSR